MVIKEKLNFFKKKGMGDGVAKGKGYTALSKGYYWVHDGSKNTLVLRTVKQGRA